VFLKLLQHLLACTLQAPFAAIGIRSPQAHASGCQGVCKQSRHLKVARRQQTSGAEAVVGFDGQARPDPKQLDVHLQIDGVRVSARVHGSMPRRPDFQCLKWSWSNWDIATTECMHSRRSQSTRMTTVHSRMGTDFSGMEPVRPCCTQHSRDTYSLAMSMLAVNLTTRYARRSHSPASSPVWAWRRKTSQAPASVLRKPIDSNAIKEPALWS
jgi:hypothetical protein